MKRLTSATAIGMILASTPALAEVTPKSVWDNLNGYYTRSGMTVETAAVDKAGDTLTVKGLVLSQDQNGTKSRIDLGDLVLSATGDGAVRMDMADEMTFTMDLPKAANATDEAALETDQAAADAAAAAADTAAEAGDPATEDAMADAETAAQDAADQAAADMAADQGAQPRKVTITAKAPNEDITIREDGAAMVYAYVLPKVDLTVTAIELDDGKIIANPVTVAVANLKGNDRIEGTDQQKIVQAATIDTLTVNLDVTADDGQSGKGQLVMNGVALNSDTALPAAEVVAAGDLGAMLKAGLTVKGDLKYASLTGNLDMVTKDEQGETRPVALKMDSADSSLTVDMNPTRIAYGGTSGAANAQFTVPELPVPVGYGLTGGNVRVDFPIMAGDAPQNFAVTYKLDGVTLTDSIWGMFDPTAALPRDPASIDVDLAGSVKVLHGLFDMVAAGTKLEDPNLSDEERMTIMAQMQQSPVDLRDISINKVALDVMGAKADVTGKLAAPEQGDMQTPVGTISGKFQGVATLLDKLGAAGLVPADQMMGVKMMLQMFGKPDPQNPEILTTELEFNAQGQIFANGQQVK